MGNSLTILAAGTFVRGDVFSDDILVVEGGIEGNIMGNRVIVKPKGWIHGDLVCRSLSIEPGGVVDGEVKVTVNGVALPPPGRAEMESLPLNGASLIEVTGEPGEAGEEQGAPS
jgi:cytoskeletal protein CcmA (bactofilin family)